MEWYLALDGGGSKLQMVLFDEQFHLRGTARTGSINRNSCSVEQARQNIEKGLDELLAQSCPDAIARVYAAFTGVADEILNPLRQRLPVGEAVDLGEARIGLLAAGITGDGVLALSGTGSDVYLVQDGVVADTVGGWGALIGDEGSGFYIGRCAVQAVIYQWEGRGPATSLTQAICREMQRPRAVNAIHAIYNTPAPAARIASFSRLVAQEASVGDPVAQEILEHCAGLMADQTAALLRRNPQASALPLTVAGGCWKTPTYYARYARMMREKQPGLNLCPPVFEPVMGGVVAELLRRGVYSPAAFAALQNEFADFMLTGKVECNHVDGSLSGNH